MDQKNLYDTSFYMNLERSVLKSSQILAPIIYNKYQPKSIIDIGCGNGIWLKAFEDLGITDYVGIDGDYVTEELFYADYKKFIPGNLNTHINLNKKYDLAICLEVGEHIETENSKDFVNTICNHSDLIVFSAALPLQGGTNHINEQWQSFWAALFEENGFQAYDELRSSIWYNPKISYWYRQNIIIYKKTNAKSVSIKSLDKMHPELEFKVKGKKNIFTQLLSNPNYVIKRFLHKRNLL